MIVGGTSNTGRGLGDYLTAQKNERAEVWELRGSAFSDLADVVRDWRLDALGTKVEKSLYHAWLRPSDTDRALSRGNWHKAIALFEKEMGFEGQPRAVVYHHGEGQGEQGHVHLVYSRIRDGKAISDSWNYVHHEKARAEIEKALNLEHVYAPHLDRDAQRHAQGFDGNQKEQAKRLKVDPHGVKADVSALYANADNGRAFVAALEDSGYTLAQGDKRGYVIIDQAGGVHSLTRASGAKVGALREALQDFPAATLSTVREVHERQRAVMRTVPQDLAQAERQDQATPRQGRRKKEGLPRDHFGKRQAFRRVGRVLTRHRAMPWHGKAWRPPRAGARLLPSTSPRLMRQSVARGRINKPVPRARRSVAMACDAEPVRPTMAQGAATGCAAMWEEFPAYKAVGLLHVWRERWRAYLPRDLSIEPPTNG